MVFTVNGWYGRGCAPLRKTWGKEQFTDTRPPSSPRISPTDGVIQLEYSLPCHPHTHTRLSSGRSQFQKTKQNNLKILSLLTRKQLQHSVQWPPWLHRHAVTSLYSPWSLRAEASQVQSQGFVTGPLALSLSAHQLRQWIYSTQAEMSTAQFTS